MKMIMSIMSASDGKSVTRELMKKGFIVTKLSSEGGFLKGKKVTLITVINQERLQLALDTIKTTVKDRKYKETSFTTDGLNIVADKNPSISANSVITNNGEIVVGGATVFVLNVEELCKY